MVLEHIKALKAPTSPYRLADILFVPEANTGLEASRMADLIDRELSGRAVHTLRLNNGGPGLWTNNYTKTASVELARVMFSESRVKWGAWIACANPFVTDKNKLEAIKSKAIQQLRSFRRIPKETASGVTVIYSGKYGPNGKKQRGRNDDLPMVMLINAYVYNLAIHDRAYLPNGVVLRT